MSCLTASGSPWGFLFKVLYIIFGGLFLKVCTVSILLVTRLQKFEGAEEEEVFLFGF